jgi:hypothetical protein
LEDIPGEHAAVPPASRRAEVAKDVAKAAAFFAAGALMDHHARSQDRRAARANRPSAWDAAASYIIDDRSKWQRDRDELTRLQLKQMRKRNGAWW